MIKNFKNKIFCENGSSYVQTAIIILVIAMIFSVVFTYVSLMITVSKTREDTQMVLDSFIIENAEDIYKSVKNGNNTTLEDVYDTKFKNLIVSELGLSQSGAYIYNKTEDNDVIFYYGNPITTNIRDNILELKTNFEIIIPVYFAGKKLFDLKIPSEIKSLYVLK